MRQPSPWVRVARWPACPDGSPSTPAAARCRRRRVHRPRRARIRARAWARRPRELPIAKWLFGWDLAVMLTASFVALAVLWSKPRLEGAGERRGRPAAGWHDVPAGALGVASVRARRLRRVRRVKHDDEQPRADCHLRALLGRDSRLRACFSAMASRPPRSIALAATENKCFQPTVFFSRPPAGASAGRAAATGGGTRAASQGRGASCGGQYGML